MIFPINKKLDLTDCDPSFFLMRENSIKNYILQTVLSKKLTRNIIEFSYRTF